MNLITVNTSNWIALASLSLSGVVLGRQLVLERRMRPIRSQFAIGENSAPPMPDEMVGYRKQGEPRHDTLRVYGHGAGHPIPDLWVVGAGSVAVLARTIRWRTVAAAKVAIADHGYISEHMPIPDSPPAEAVIGTSGLWEGHAGTQPVFWSAEPNPNLLIDVTVEIQQWELSP